MTVRTKKATVTFRRPLKPTSFNCQQPTETCRLVIDEEESFRLLVLAYQRTATMLHTLAILDPQRAVFARFSRSILED